MSESTVYKFLFVVTFLIIIHALLHVFKVQHPDVPAFLLLGGLTLIAAQVYGGLCMRNGRPGLSGPMVVVAYSVVALIGAVVASLVCAIGGLGLLSVLGCALLGSTVAALAAVCLTYMGRS
jgi:hypothetical protein